MATTDDTSKHRRSRRNQQQQTTAAPRAVMLVSAAELQPTMPKARTLEEAIENVRTLMLQMRGLLHCLSEVLLYADDDDSVMHAEVAYSASGWANLAAAELDLVKLKPLIETIKQHGSKAA